jgi:hypothetical protein
MSVLVCTYVSEKRSLKKLGQLYGLGNLDVNESFDYEFNAGFELKWHHFRTACELYSATS